MAEIVMAAFLLCRWINGWHGRTAGRIAAWPRSTAPRPRPSRASGTPEHSQAVAAWSSADPRTPDNLLTGRYVAAVGRAPGSADEMHGFSRAVTSLVGRAAEVGEVAALVGEYRLVTVTGPGGVGKTRLASEVARLVAARFADGVWLVELAAVQDPALVPALVAGALGLPQRPGVPVMESLVTGVARQQLLLVLDNCEHLLGAVAELCGALLRVADDVRMLAISREPAGVAGEARYRLQPLAVMEPGAPGKAAAPGEAGRPAALALFADRARQADPRFVLDGEAGPVAARLVARLDGMPLAIELAAARVEALGLAQLLDRLEDSFGLLPSADRAAAPRHRSLAATVEWSYRLLDEQERKVFRRLAGLPGPV